MKPTLILIAITVLGCQLQAQVSFKLSSTLDVDQYPDSITAADVNGDGKLDLISAIYWEATLTVQTNNGMGGFSQAGAYPVSAFPFGIFPISVVAADVNGDGKLDLISANYGTTTLSVLTNNGSGGFVLSSQPVVGNAPISVVAVDINSDGRLDLISADLEGTTLSVLTNNGSGGFVLAGFYTVGAYPACVQAVDLNKDGRVDLISANSGDNTLSVLTNNGSGGFVLASTPVVGDSPFSVVTGDVNGDGELDLISADSGTNTLTVLTNVGSGRFALADTYAVGNKPQSIIAADVDGDGRVDLISANWGMWAGNTLSVLTNNGSGGFVMGSTPVVGIAPLSVTAADVNWDGKLDLISANQSDNTLTILTNATVFPPPTSTPSININVQGHGMVVSWPSAAAGWSLQQNPDWTKANWCPSGYSGYGITDDGTNKNLIIPSEPGSLFFRLLHP